MCQRNLVGVFGIGLALFGSLLVPINAAFACACCAETAYRYVETQPIDEMDREILDALVFGDTADISVGPADEVKGIDLKLFPLQLKVGKDSQKWVFKFSGEGGESGTA